MTVIPHSIRTRIESNFWSTLVLLMDNYEFARKMTPKVMVAWQQSKQYFWIAKSFGLAIFGLFLGFIAGIIAKLLMSF